MNIVLLLSDISHNDAMFNIFVKLKIISLKDFISKFYLSWKSKTSKSLSFNKERAFVSSLSELITQSSAPSGNVLPTKDSVFVLNNKILIKGWIHHINATHLWRCLLRNHHCRHRHLETPGSTVLVACEKTLFLDWTGVIKESNLGWLRLSFVENMTQSMFS